MIMTGTTNTQGTTVLDTITIERIPGTKYVRLIKEFHFYSTILRRWGRIPKGFIYDEESVPVLRGTNPEAGAIHDYFCRTNSVPVVDKETAAMICNEFQQYYNNMANGSFARIWGWIKRHVKTDFVEIAPNYFHRLPVEATLDQVKEVV